MNIEDITTYPLTWPTGQARTTRPARAKFGYRSTGNGERILTVAEARDRLLKEIRRLQGEKHAIKGPVRISSNLQQNQDGSIRGQQPQPHDTGIAVYFYRRGKPYVLASDAWDTVQANMKAITMHIDALRGQERWKVGSLEQAMRGYELPATASKTPWWTVLGVERTASLEVIEARYRQLALERHPDRGGTDEAMAELSEAIRKVREEKTS